MSQLSHTQEILEHISQVNLYNHYIYLGNIYIISKLLNISIFSYYFNVILLL